MSLKTLIKFAEKSFTLPDTCVRLRHCLDDPKTDLDDAAAIIAVDPSMSAKVLKLANSALFRFPSQIETIPKAISVLGGEAAYNISIVETANNAFSKIQANNIDFAAFWNKAIMSGVLAKSLAQQVQMRGSERYFALGILQTLSELLVAAKLPEKYAEYLADESAELALIKQQALFRFSFAHCSGHVCKAWGLPQSIYQPLIRQSSPPQDRLSQEDSVMYITMAMLSAYQHDLSFKELPRFNTQALSCLDLSDDDYDMVLNFAKIETFKIAQLTKS